jgi:hypothetical protein
MAKGFTVKATAPQKSAEDWDYDAIKASRLSFVFLDVDVLSFF